VNLIEEMSRHRTSELISIRFFYRMFKCNCLKKIYFFFLLEFQKFNFFNES